MATREHRKGNIMNTRQELYDIEKYLSTTFDLEARERLVELLAEEREMDALSDPFALETERLFDAM